MLVRGASDTAAGASPLRAAHSWNRHRCREQRVGAGGKTQLLNGIAAPAVHRFRCREAGQDDEPVKVTSGGDEHDKCTEREHMQSTRHDDPPAAGVVFTDDRASGGVTRRDHVPGR